MKTRLKVEAKHHIGIRIADFGDGHRAAKLSISLDGRQQFAIYTDLTEQPGRKIGHLWGVVTIHNPALPHGNTCVSLSSFEADRIARDALSWLHALRAAPPQTAAA